MKNITLIVLLFATLVTAGCEHKIPATETERPPAFDPQHFSGGRIYTISGENSEIRIRVYRGGPLARLGHNHVIATRDIRGKLYHHPELRRSGLVMSLPVNSFDVDTPEHRQGAGEGFDVMPSEKDIQGTRNNMLSERLLHSDQFPYVEIVSVEISGELPEPDILLRIAVRDVSHDVRIQAGVQLQNNKLIIDGKTRLSQSQLGLTPFSILMGAIAVQDEMDIEFHLVAEN